MAIIGESEAARRIGITVSGLSRRRRGKECCDLLASPSEWPYGRVSYDADRVDAYAVAYKAWKNERYVGISSQEASDILGVSTSKLYSWRRNKERLDLILDDSDMRVGCRYDEAKVRELASLGVKAYSGRPTYPGHYTSTEAADILGITRVTLIYWRDRGQHPEIFVRNGGKPQLCYKDKVHALRDEKEALKRTRMTSAQAAECLGLTVDTFRYWCSQDKRPELYVSKSTYSGIPSYYDSEKVMALAREMDEMRRICMTEREAVRYLGVRKDRFRKTLRYHLEIYKSPLNGARMYRRDALKALKARLSL